jgi:hypothetical protein
MAWCIHRLLVLNPQDLGGISSLPLEISRLIDGPAVYIFLFVCTKTRFMGFASCLVLVDFIVARRV